MFDGTNSRDISTYDGGQRLNDCLTFRTLVDEKTGVILDPTRQAFDRGLTFRVLERQTGPGHRLKMKGSLHKFHNHGHHNADQFTVNDLLMTLDQLVRKYGFDLSKSTLNGVEFGVNIELPFPVGPFLANLIVLGYKSFSKDTRSNTPYYVCERDQYRIKIYDKGKQQGLPGNLLRFEIRIKKMEYFKCTGIRLATLADLLNVVNYPPLGTMLMDTFNEILFDDPAIDTANLTPHDRDTYQNGRNPRFWQIPDNLTTQQRNTHIQRLVRLKRRFQVLLDRYGNNRQREVAALISQKWEQLTTVDDDLLKRINEHRVTWQNMTQSDVAPAPLQPTTSPVTPQPPGLICHELTDPIYTSEGNESGVTCHEITNFSKSDLSRINPLYSPLICDTDKPNQPLAPGAIVCPVTGAVIEQPRRGQRFVSAAMLRTNDDLLTTLQDQFKEYAKGSKVDQFEQAAKGVRNAESNRRNNLARRVRRALNTPGLFPPDEIVRLTDDQRAALDFWRGTPYEVRF